MSQTPVGRADDLDAWRSRLPALPEDLATRWDLVLGTTVSNGPDCLVIRARRQHTPLILKLTPPSRWNAHEARALALWDGRGAVRLVALDVVRGALLLECAEPGYPLASLCARDDRAATAAAAEVMRELHRVPADHATELPRVSDWVARLELPEAGDVPHPLRDTARTALAAAQELLAQRDGWFVLHGDLHHQNVVRATRAPWLALDPKGVVGPREAEAAALLRNPRSFVLGHRDPVGLIRDRLSVLEERGALDPAALRAWGWVLAVIAAWWSFEDREPDWKDWLACAAVLADAGART
jgi:streptomycin 6-kinase